MRKVIVFSILIIIPVLLFAAFWLARPASSAPLAPQSPAGAGPAWYDPEWHYRRLVTVTNSSTALTNYQVLVKLDSAFDFIHAQTDGDDLRVTASDGTTPLSFWVESWDYAGTKAWVWVKVPSLPAGDTILYFYYGYTSVGSASDGANTFEAYDGYETYALNTAPWGNYTENPASAEWDRYAGTPVLQRGASGSWDSGGATFASVISDTIADEYRMYYHGWGSTSPCTGSCIGLATSEDGLTWTKYGTTPVMTPTLTWNAGGVRVPIVWMEGARYYMIYTGRDASGNMQVGFADSANGIKWRKYATPVFNDPTWAHDSTENWGVIKVGSEYLMWYSNFGARQSGIARTTILTNTWTRYPTTPIFASSGGPGSYTYSQYCPFTFKYGGYYYVLVPSYNWVSDYARYYLYRSVDPYFTTRELVRVAHTVGASGQWDAQDSDTPFVFTTAITRTLFPGDQLRTYYAGASAGGTWAEGLLIENNIDTALAAADLPYGVGWANSSSISVTVVNTPVRQGSHSLRLNDTGSAPVSSRGTFAQKTQGEVGVWVRRTSSGTGGTDLYLYGNGPGAPGDGLAAVVGLGGSSQRFHYWSRNTFYNVGTQWSADTWYYVSIIFNIGTNTYNFVVYNTNMNEIVRVDGINMWRTTTPGTYVNSAMLYTDGASYVGRAYWDDFRLRKYVPTEPTTAVRSYSDIQERVTVSGTGPLTFNYTGIGMYITTTNQSFTSVQIIRYNHTHPRAPDNQKPEVRRYWEIIPNGGASGYTATLTLPHPRVPSVGTPGDMVCYYVVSPEGWDCAANSYDAVNGTITRMGIHDFSEWTTQEDFNPTAITLKNLETSSKPHLLVPGLLAAGLVSLLAAGFLWRRRVRFHP
jgi:hypothetical protein